MTAGGTGATTWTDVWTRHGETIRRYAYSRMGRTIIDSMGADDIVQEVFSKMMTAGPPDARHTEQYLITAVKNRITDAHRRQARIDPGGNDPDEAAAPPSPAGTADASGGQSQASFEDGVDARIDAGRALALVTNDRQRYALVQRIMLGRPAKDIAEDLELPSPQRVSQLYNPALDEIRKSSAFEPPPSRVSSVNPATDPQEETP